jgi:hypothetical protein
LVTVPPLPPPLPAANVLETNIGDAKSAAARMTAIRVCILILLWVPEYANA